MTNKEAAKLVVVGWMLAVVFCLVATIESYIADNFRAALFMLLAASTALYGGIWNYLHYWSDRATD